MTLSLKYLIKQYPSFCLLILLSAGLGLRVWRAYFIPYPERDEILYSQLAEQNLDQLYSYLYNGKHIMPLYLVVVHYVSRFTSLSTYSVGRGVNILAGTLLIYIIFCIGKTIFSNDCFSFMLAILATVNPTSVHFSSAMLREEFYFLFGACAILMFLKGTEKIWNHLWCGFFCACSILTRLEGLEFLIFFLGWLLLLCIFKVQTVQIVLKRAFLLLFGFGTTWFVLMLLLKMSFQHYWFANKSFLVMIWFTCHL